MTDFKFTNEEARKEYEEKLNALKKIVEDNSVDSAYLWDATVQKYAAKMEKVKKILQMEGINELITAKMFKDISTKGSDAYFFWIAFRNNILAVLVTVPGQLVLGLIVAVLIHNLKTGKNVYKVLLYIAVICDWVVFCNIIDYIFQPDEGSLVNYCLTTIGILKEPVACCRIHGQETLLSGSAQSGRAMAGL